MCRWASMKPGIAVMPLASMVFPGPGGDGAPAATEAIFPAADDDRSAFDHGAVGDDDAGVRDGEVLRSRGCDCRQRERDDKRGEMSFHRHSVYGRKSIT